VSAPVEDRKAKPHPVRGLVLGTAIAAVPVVVWAIEGGIGAGGLAGWIAVGVAAGMAWVRLFDHPPLILLPLAAGSATVIVAGIVDGQVAATAVLGGGGAGYAAGWGLFPPSPPPAPKAERPPPGALRAYVFWIIERQPHPPRDCDPELLLRLARRANGLAYLLLWTVPFWAWIFYEMSKVVETSGDRLAYAAAIAVVTALIGGLALAGEHECRKVRRAVESGPVAPAEITKLSYEPDERFGGYSISPTLKLRCEVHHPRAGFFPARVTEHGPEYQRWGPALDAGAELEVIVDADKPRVLFWLGPS
jgi:hypothetical protein